MEISAYITKCRPVESRIGDQDAALLDLEDTLEAELLALVPQDSRTAAEATLLLLLELHTVGRAIGGTQPS